MGKLHFYKVTDVGFIANEIAAIIDRKLTEGQKVIWLLSGGSAIAVACAAASLLAGLELDDLTVGLVDERFGQPGHTTSNWRQLETAGFKLTGADFKPILTGRDFKTSAAEYNRFISRIAGQDSYKIGLLGIGADGHTAGILPSSPAVDSDQYADGYEGPDYERITLTGKGLRVLDKAVVYAAGMAKKGAIEKLAKQAAAAEQPAQLLKGIADVDVYNDVIGDNI